MNKEQGKLYQLSETASDNGEETEEEMSDIKLDFSVLEQQETTTSLEELYGYPVFSQEFEAAIAKEKEQKEERREEAFQRVSQGERKTDYAKVFAEVLKAETQAVIRSETTKTQTRENPLRMAGCVLVGACLAGCVLCLLKRKGKEKGEHETKDYRALEWESL